MINNSPSPNSVFRSGNNGSVIHSTPPPPPTSPTEKIPHRLRLPLGMYTSERVKFVHNKFLADPNIIYNKHINLYIQTLKNFQIKTLKFVLNLLKLDDFLIIRNS